MSLLIKIFDDVANKWRFITSTSLAATGSLSLGETSQTAYRGDRGKTAYDHSQSTHAPATAQVNNISDVNAGLLTGGGETILHSHAGGGGLSQAQVLSKTFLL